MPTSTSSSSRQPPADANGKRPVHEVRHRNIRATVWRNETAKGSMYNVTVSRSYRDDNGEWHDTGSFGFDDLMNLAKALYDAHSFISALQAKERGGMRTQGGSTAGRSAAR
jgi:hypothetical protein